MKRDPNMRIDPRHAFENSVSRPIPNDEKERPELEVRRCKGCHRLWTEWELYMAGKCPACNSKTVIGASPNFFEMIRLIFLGGILRSWRVWGRKGRGFEKAFRESRGLDATEEIPA